VTASSAHLNQPSSAHETTMTMEMAENRFIEDSEVLTFITFTVTILLKLNQISIIEKYVFNFNINDVLIRGKKVIPKAIKAIRLLNE
jgi:hypothetical protein